MRQMGLMKGNRHDRKLEKFSENFNEMFDFFLNSYRNKEKATRQSRCIICSNEDVRDTYKKSEKRRAAILKNQKEKVAHYRNFTNEYKENKGCEKCKIKYQYYILEFHHLESEEKEANISVLIKSAGKKRIEEEIAKCIVVCSNCHKEIHYSSGNWNPRVGIFI